MILVDTSIWIDLFAGRNNQLITAFEAMIDAGEDFCTCGVIMTEVLQGIRNDNEYDQTLSILSGLLYLPMNTASFIHAGNIYRNLRKQGITIRKTIDCIIAAVCLDHDVRLLHNDNDFTRIARYVPLQIIEE